MVFELVSWPLLRARPSLVSSPHMLSSNLADTRCFACLVCPQLLAMDPKEGSAADVDSDPEIVALKAELARKKEENQNIRKEV